MTQTSYITPPRLNNTEISVQDISFLILSTTFALISCSLKHKHVSLYIKWIPHSFITIQSSEFCLEVHIVASTFKFWNGNVN